MSALEQFQQLALRFTDPIQHDYEVIRGIMLADETVAERSRATGLDRATVGEKARRFVQHGMFGLIDRRTTTTSGQHPYPAVVAGYILYLKQLYPPMHDREIAHIVGRKYGYRTNHHTVKHFLERHPIPVQLPLPMTTPVDVLSWMCGGEIEMDRLHRALCHLQVERVVNGQGYVSVQRFYIYAERGLTRRRVSVWRYDGRLQVAHRAALLARYAYRYEKKREYTILLSTTRKI